MKRYSFFILIFISFCSFSQKLYFPASRLKDSAQIQSSIKLLAKQVIGKYREEDRLTYLDNLFRFEIAAQEYDKSLLTIDALKRLYSVSNPESGSVARFEFQTFSDAKLYQLKTSKTFNDSYLFTLSRLQSKLNEIQINYAARNFGTALEPLKNVFFSLLKKQVTDSITFDDAKEICRIYASYDTYKQILPVGKPYFEDLERKLYSIQDSVQVKMRDGSTIQVLIVRSKKAITPLPAILNFNIYVGTLDKRLAKPSAIYGYVGVVANTRGKGLSPQSIEPFEKDASDAYDIIDWISKQPWCNGSVGMYGGSYLGFSQWAAAKTLHPALKTIIPQVAVGIGIDYPMQNNVFMSYMLRWIHYVTNTKLSDLTDFDREVHWNSLFTQWYKSGSAFRSLDNLEGRKSEIFQRWLQHPSYDSYWQNMASCKNDFSKINIPVLTITGYFDDDQLGAMHYYKEHLLYNKNANHTLLIGPYSHSGAQDTPLSELGGYKIDPVANINISKLLFQWFDYTLKDSIRPAILKDKVNYQVMGANSWKHHSTLTEMSNDTLQLYFSSVHSGNYNKLTTTKGLKKEFIIQKVDFLNRHDTSNLDENIITKELSKGDYVTFASDRFEEPITVNSSFYGEIKALLNKKDFDLSIKVYEELPDGTFFNLSSFLGRASYAKDRSQRQLLEPGKEETIPYSNSFFTSKKLSKGSRLIILIGVNKNKNWQINYGTGKDVSDETIEDGKVPLEIKWFNDSYIKIPVWKGE